MAQRSCGKVTMKNLFLFTGDETYLLRQQLTVWKQAFIAKHGDLNLIELDVTQAGPGQMAGDILAAPFLAEKRLIFIHGLPEAPKVRQADKVSKADEEREEKLEELLKALPDIPESNVVVFVQPGPDRRKRFYKELTKRADVKEFKPLEGKALMDFIVHEATKYGSSISSADAEALLGLTGANLWRLNREIEKLATFAGQSPITREMITNLVTPNLETNIFQLTDALGAKDHRKAIRCLHATVAAGEDLHQIFYMIARQFRLLLQANDFAARHSRPDSAQMAARLKLHPFVAKNALNQAVGFKYEELKKAHRYLLDIDHQLKTSRIKVTREDQEPLALAIERFIVEFCVTKKTK